MIKIIGLVAIVVVVYLIFVLAAFPVIAGRSDRSARRLFDEKFFGPKGGH